MGMRLRLLHLTFLTLVIAPLALLTFYFLPARFYSSHFWYLLALFYLINIMAVVLFHITEKKAAKGSGYLVAFGSKFLAYLVLIVVFLVVFKQKSSLIAAYLLVLYLIYTIYGVGSNLLALKKNKKSDGF